MAGESQQTPRNEPDPTVLTTQQLDRAIDAMKEFVLSQLAVRDERLHGIDTATKLRIDTINGVSQDVAEKILHERELTTEKFSGVAQRFTERDIRSEREARDNKVAVDAAFAAQKEAAAKQDEGNQKAIDKSEKATGETISKLAELFGTTIRGLEGKIEDVKSRVSINEAAIASVVQRRQGGEERVTEHRQSYTSLIAVGAFVITVILAVIAMIGFFKKPGT